MKTLFNPFEKYSEKKLILLGIAFTLIGATLSYYFKARYDGILDLHFVPNISIQETIVDSLVNIISLVSFLFLFGKIINKKTRFIDILTTSMIARFPMYLLSIFNSNELMNKALNEIIQLISKQAIDQISSSTWTISIIFGLCLLPTMIWYIALLFNGFKVASNAKGKQSIILFILGVLFAEIVSKLLIYQLN